MRDYLQKFFDEYKYEKADKEHLLGAYDIIMSTPEAKDAFEAALALYNSDYCCDHSEIIRLADRAADITGVNEYTAQLLVYQCITRRLLELYTERNISKDIYDKTVLDLRYKLEECKLVYGIQGSFVADWFAGFYRLTRFAIGRLQFEVIDFGANYEKNGFVLTPDTKVLNVHIPRSLEPLTPEACSESYAMAKEFFADKVGNPCPIVCSSWLLYPMHEQILPKHTNTYKFFKSFDIFSSKTDRGRSDLWRIFDTMEKRIDKLPADTSLRRAYIEHLKNGGKTGSGRGVLFF